jgi:hypothetical protein
MIKSHKSIENENNKIIVKNEEKKDKHKFTNIEHLKHVVKLKFKNCHNQVKGL